MHIMFDIESDGPIQGFHSMISMGAVVVENGLKRTFYDEMKPIGDNYVEDALAVSGFSREDTMSFEEASVVMKRFEKWLRKINPKNERLYFWSDNNGYDFAWINWYTHTYLGNNPFRHSSNNLRNVFNGMNKNMKKSFKYLRKTKHTHNALDDAKGNAEALLEMTKMGLKI